MVVAERGFQSFEVGNERRDADRQRPPDAADTRGFSPLSPADAASPTAPSRAPFIAFRLRRYEAATIAIMLGPFDRRRCPVRADGASSPGARPRQRRCRRGAPRISLDRGRDERQADDAVGVLW